MELDLAHNLKRVFRKGKFHQLGFLFSSPVTPAEHGDSVRQKRLSAVVTPTRRRLVSQHGEWLHIHGYQWEAIATTGGAIATSEGAIATSGRP